MIYLDHNATTPLSRRAADAMLEWWRAGPCNPSSQHSAGRRARRGLEDAREGIAGLLGARLYGPTPDRLVFTSGGTEANNLAIFGLAALTELPAAATQQTPPARTPASRTPRGVAQLRPPRQATEPPSPVRGPEHRPQPHAIVSAVEHPSVLGPAAQLARSGWAVDYLPVDADGVAMVRRLPELLRPETRLVALMLANNETGVLQPVAEAAEICRRAGVPLHVDAVQAAGKVRIDFCALGAATLAVAAHKFNGPLGVGALLVRHGVPLVPRLFGGVQEEGLRPGTQAVALAAGMHAALAEWDAERVRRHEHLLGLRELFERLLREGVPDLVVHGERAARLPHTSCVALPGVERQAMHLVLDRVGVAASTGSACASGASEPSPTLRAMGLPEAIVSASLRFSLGPSNTEWEVREACRLIISFYKDLRDANAGCKSGPRGRIAEGDTL